MASGGVDSFSRGLSGRQWSRIGTRRRSAVATPLFSLRSSRSAGVGEIPDLKLLADWCEKTGIGIVQLLPMNDVGNSFRPYDAESSLALEPMHLSLGDLAGVPPAQVARRIESLKSRFPASNRFDPAIKRAKLDLLADLHASHSAESDPDFKRFKIEQDAWLSPYVVFRILKERHGGAGWETWPEREKDPSSARAVEAEMPERAAFHRWVQWQLYRQLVDAKKYANSKGVLLMGDLPLLVARDSADVWSEPDCFKLGFAAGAPPDPLFAGGQKWGMPPQDWERVEAKGWAPFLRKLKYAEHFYDLFRIDHFVGLFRLWTIPVDGSGAEGFFDPREEDLWEARGRKIVRLALEKSEMLPCAEDLGTVPDASFKVLNDCALPGMDVQRWMKHGWERYDFKSPSEYRVNSIATVSTHDITALAAWWEFEAGTVDETVFAGKCRGRGIDPHSAVERLFDRSRSAHGRLRWKNELSDWRALPHLLELPEYEIGDFVDLFRSTFDERAKFWKFCGLKGEPSDKATPEFVAAALTKANEAASVFSSQLLQDWLALGDALKKEDLWDFRINFPGTADDRNWRIVLPVSLEEMLELPINAKIREINAKTGRA